MCMSVLPVYTAVYCIHAAPRKARRGCWILWDWSYRQL